MHCFVLLGLHMLQCKGQQMFSTTCNDGVSGDVRLPWIVVTKASYMVKNDLHANGIGSPKCLGSLIHWVLRVGERPISTPGGARQLIHVCWRVIQLNTLLQKKWRGGLWVMRLCVCQGC